MDMNEKDNTSDNDPTPFILENDGTIDINLSVNATALWSSVSLNTSYFQVKANTTFNNNSFDIDNSIMTFLNMSNYLQQIIATFNHTDANDWAAVDILVQAPANEPGGQKSATVNFYGEGS